MTLTSKYRTAILFASLSLSAFALGGCGADTDDANEGGDDVGSDSSVELDVTSQDTGEADTGETDTGEADTGEADTGEADVVPTDTGTEFNCDSLPVEANAGQPCDNTDECPNGFCVRLTAEGQSTCFQPCAPDICEGPCGVDDRCVGGMTDADGNPVMYDETTEAGICVNTVGNEPSWGECDGAETLCSASSQCATFTAEGAGTCLPACDSDADCDVFEGFQPACILGSGENPEYCGITCDATAPSCPTDMVCTELGGAAICTR